MGNKDDKRKGGLGLGQKVRRKWGLRSEGGEGGVSFVQIAGQCAVSRYGARSDLTGE